MWSGGPFVFAHGGSPLLEAGSPLPFPLRSDLGDLADRHGAGVPARGPTYFERHITLYYRRMTQKMGAKGQVVIPKELRELAGLGPGSSVDFEPVDDGIVVRRADRRSTLRGRFSGSGMATRLLEDRQREPH